VPAVVHLIFNERYAATGGGARVRAALCDEAIRLARLLATLLPGQPEALGLAAPMLFHDEQDRGRWDHRRIREPDSDTPPDDRELTVGAGLLHRAGRTREARDAYPAAAAKPRRRDFLARRLAALTRIER
jgi:RNA polymerase sigma-70 factor (ECF subfamily)